MFKYLQLGIILLANVLSHLHAVEATPMQANNPSALATEQWQPLQHPATIKRQINGYTEAIYQMELAAEVSARVLEIPIDVGMQAIGSQQIKLDDRLAQIEVQLATAQEQQAQTQLEIAETNLQTAQSLGAYRKKEEERITRLITENVASTEQHDAVVFQSEQARIAIAKQLAQRENAKQQVLIAQANLLRAQEWLQRHTIEIPNEWTVSKRLVQLQTLVQPGTPILQLNDTRNLVIRLYLSEEEIAALRQLEIPQLRLTQTQQQVKVSIKSINSTFDPVSRKREVELQAASTSFPEASGGLHCTLSLKLQDPHNTVLIPRQFIKDRFEQKRVQTLDGQWIPILIMRVEDKMAIVAANQFPLDCTLKIPEND